MGHNLNKHEIVNKHFVAKNAQKLNGQDVEIMSNYFPVRERIVSIRLIQFKTLSPDGPLAGLEASDFYNTIFLVQ